MSRHMSPLALPLALVAAACTLRLALAPAFSSGMAARREMLGAVAAGVVALNSPLPALADWQGEPSRALKKYGSAVLALEGAVAKGDLAAIKPKLRKFTLLCGAWRFEPSDFRKFSAIADALIEGAENNKVDVVQAKYAQLLKETGLKQMLKGAPVPKGARVIDTGSSIAGISKLSMYTES
mmetsp:Transcript_91654/g.233140  ORF Transcript_91654/g.233140 Transcript_91654/m.233140 type:complete len:181 (-) Transcript_91654:107-649(-)